MTANHGASASAATVGLIEYLRTADQHDLVLRATLGLAVLHGGTSPGTEAVIRGCTIAAFVAPVLLRSPALWLSVALSVSWGTVRGWWQVDNHYFLLTYWIWFCFFSTIVAVALSQAARGLVATAFCYAVLWKAISVDFLSGDFMYATALIDSRLLPITGFIVSDQSQAITDGAEAITRLLNSGRLDLNLPMVFDPTLRAVATGFSAVGFGLEALIALSSVWNRLASIRHLTLIAFTGVTYFVLPVTGFGFLLAVLGLAQCSQSQHGLRVAYLMLMLVVQLTIVPWRNFLQ